MRRFILGTDWWTDCDDAVALRLLTRAHRAGEIELTGVVLNACMPRSVESVDAFLCADGLDVPIGLDSAATDFAGTPVYQYAVCDRACRYHDNAQAEDAVRLYRRLISQGHVELIEIGFMNVLAALLESGPDDISPLTGCELVEKYVDKLWIMAGKWDEQAGQEHNFNNNERSRRAAQKLCELCPAPVTFLGWEVGVNVISGKNVPQDDILYTIMKAHGSEHGRHSWDPMTALLAVTGDIGQAGYREVRGRARVDGESGANFFYEDAAGMHSYVVKERPNDWYEAEIERRIR